MRAMRTCLVLSLALAVHPMAVAQQSLDDLLRPSLAKYGPAAGR